MTHPEFQEAFRIANSEEDLTNVDDSHLFGFGLPDFQPTSTTLKAVAKIIRWQAHQFNGEWNSKMLEEVRRFGKKRFLIVG